MAWCLNKNLSTEFLRKLKSGELNPDELSTMTSAERNALFSGFLGEDNAKEVNALFESKLLLKNQKQGMITWAQKVGRLNPEARTDVIARINRLEKVMNPVEERMFFADLAAKKLGTEVTVDEAKKIAELAKKVDDLRGVPEKRIEYGNAVLDFYDYMNSLNPVKASVTTNILNLPKTAMSTLDFSAPFRQGWGMMSRKEFWSNYADMFKAAFSEKQFRNMQADIISRPTYQTMKQAGLRITTLGDKLSQREEQFMSSLLDKVPGVRGSERAYVIFLSKLRADVFDNLLKASELRGESVAPGSQSTKDLASVVNNFTGAGAIGKGDKYGNAVPVLNATLFSPRKLSATIGMLNPVNYLNPKISRTARMAAFRQLIGSLLISSTVLGLAKISGAGTEEDPTSSDFGKIQAGGTRYDVTGSNGSYAVLLARLMSNKTKSTTTGKITELGKGYKAATRADLIVKFARNKLSPTASFVADFLYGSDAIGQPFKVSSAVLNRIKPLIISNVIETAKKDPASVLPVLLAEMFGVGTQTY